ncbi:hypothetical protein L0F63_006756, partial [Massospora cicadina]
DKSAAEEAPFGKSFKDWCSDPEGDAPELSDWAQQQIFSIDSDIEAGKTPLAIDKFATFLKESTSATDALEGAKVVAAKLFRPKAPELSSLRVRSLSEMATRNFFLAECKTREIWMQVARDIIYTAVNSFLFKHWADFGSEYKQIILTLTKVCYQRYAEKCILHILDQIGCNAEAYNATLSCFSLTQVPTTVYTNFSLSLLRQMDQLHLKPSAEAYANVIDRFVTRVLINSPKRREYLNTVMNLYREAFEHTALEEWVYVSILKALAEKSSLDVGFGEDFRRVAGDMIEFGYKIPLDLVIPVLCSLLPKGTNGVLLRSLLNNKPYFKPNDILTLWELVKQDPSLPNDRCFLIIAHCYPRMASSPSTANDVLKRLFFDFLTTTDPTAPRSYVPIVLAFGLTGSSSKISQLQGLLLKNGVIPDATLLNAILFACINSGNSQAVLSNFMHYTKLSEPFRNVNPQLVNKVTWAFATQAACEKNDFRLAMAFYDAIFGDAPMEPLTWRAYRSLLFGFRAVLFRNNSNPNGTNRGDIPSEWAIAQVHSVMDHMKLTKYSGPVSSLYQLALEANANYIRGIKTQEQVDSVYPSLISQFNALIRTRHVPPEPSTCLAIFNAMVNVIEVQPTLGKVVADDLLRIYQYLVEMRVRVECQTYGLMFKILGNLGEAQLIEKLFERFLFSCRSGALLNPRGKAVVFTAYILNVLIPAGRIPGLLSKMVKLEAHPSEHTFQQLFRNLSKQEASLAVLYDLLYKVKDYLPFTPTPDPDQSALDPDIFVSLLDAVAEAFVKEGGPSEMTKAVNYLLALIPSYKLRAGLPGLFYKHVIELALASGKKGADKVAMRWLERLVASGAPDAAKSLQEVLALVSEANPAAFPYLSTPGSLAWLQSIQDSITAKPMALPQQSKQKAISYVV